MNNYEQLLEVATESLRQKEAETPRLKAENDTLRRLLPALNAPCVYCGLTDISKCASGFPGCAQADDLMVGDDEVMKRLLEDNKKLKEQLQQAIADKAIAEKGTK